MAMRTADLARQVETATARLLATVEALDDRAVREPSPLPGWTRGHVLTHVARNADGLANLLGWTRGSRTPMYPSRDVRNLDIERGSGRPVAELLVDLRDSADRFAAALAAVPADGWDTVAELSSGRRLPAREIPWRRLVELEVHHADLDAGYGPDDWADPFTARFLAELVDELPDRTDGMEFTVHASDASAGAVPADATPPVVSGAPAALVSWLAGRSDGAGLTVHPAGPLPALPRWR